MHRLLGPLLIAVITTAGTNGSAGETASDAGTGSGQTYYVDPIYGRDSNSGHAPDAAWRSLNKVNSFAFQPGDTVLFRRNGNWMGELHLHDSGSETSPITFGAYDDGEKPKVSQGRHGIYADDVNHIVIENLHVAKTTAAAIVAKNSTDWTLRGLKIEGTGDGEAGGGLQWWHGHRLTVSDSEFSDINGDGLWIWNSSETAIRNNKIYTVRGASADNLHMFQSEGFEVRRNYMTMSGKTDSTKGNMITTGGREGIIVDNIFVAGNYGLGVTDDEILVDGNCFIGHAGETWSAAILVSETHDVANNSFVNNVILNPFMGIYILALENSGHQRQNFQFRNNLIHNPTQNAITIESPISGSFADNVIWAPHATEADSLIELSAGIIDEQAWDVSDNAISTDPAARPVPDLDTPSAFDAQLADCRGMSSAQP